MKKIIILFSLFFLLSPVFGQSWNLVWSDEFNYSGLPDNTKWVHEVGLIRNQELQYYTNKRLENCKVENGNLLIIGKKESYNGSDYTSACITTENKYNFKYGKVEARIKLPRGQGMWPAFWMLGQNIQQVGWPQCGEVDIMEQINDESKNHGTMHWDNDGHKKYGSTIPCDVQQYHVYSIEWNENAITWFLDGTKYWEGNIKDSINSTGEFHKPFYLMLNLAIGGSWPGSPDATTLFPDTMSVDYVRVYQQMTTTSSSNPDHKSIQLTPNPTNDILTITIPQPYRSGDLKIVDIKGTECINRHIDDAVTQLPVGQLTKGIYFLKFRKDILSVTQKFIKS